LILNNYNLDINKAVAAANEAFNTWRHTSVETRAKFLNAIADEIEKRKDSLAALEVEDMGKPLAEAEMDMGGNIFIRSFIFVCTNIFIINK
jgi:acyl-CoA reductase-like NAD-dependent aldehyde dehydrogenase